jgi:hypothetical protein
MIATLGVIALAASILAITSAVSAQGRDVSGRWTAKLEKGGRSMTSTMNLRASGDQVTGTIDLAPDVTVQIRNGKFEGSQLTFDVTAPEHGRTKEVHFAGDIGDDVITLRNESRDKQGKTMIFHKE